MDKLLLVVWVSCTPDIIVDRLKREFKVEVNQGAPQVTYRESITSGVEHREFIRKQSGGRGNLQMYWLKLSHKKTQKNQD